MNLFSAARQALRLAGVDTPAFEALFNAAKAAVTPGEQRQLQSEYDAAKARSDSAHQGLQDAGRGRR